MLKNKSTFQLSCFFLAACLVAFSGVLLTRNDIYANVPVSTIVVPIHSKEIQDRDAWSPAFAFSPDSQRLATIDGLRYLSLWQMPSLKHISSRRLSIFPTRDSLAWMPGSNNLAIDDSGTQSLIWNASSPYNVHLARTIADKDPAYCSQAEGYKISATGSLVAEGSADGTVQIWNTVTQQHTMLSHKFPQRLSSAGDDLCGFAVSPDALTVAAAYIHVDDYIDRWGSVNINRVWPVQIRLFSAQTGKQLRTWYWKDLTFSERNYDNMALAFSPDDSCLATTDDVGITLWDAKSGKRLRTLLRGGDNRQGGDKSIAFIPGTPYLASDTCAPADIQIWNTQTGRLVQVFHNGIRAEMLAVSPNGRYLASEDMDNIGNGTIKLWDLSRLEH